MAIITSANHDGKHHDDNSIENIINYILRPDKIIHGYFGYSGFACCAIQNNMIVPFLVESMRRLSNEYERKGTIKIRHFIVSFSPEEMKKPAVVDQIARRCMEYFASEYQCIYGVHEDTDNLHFHIAFNPLNRYNGQRYRGQHGEFNCMVSFFANILYEFGIRHFEYRSKNL